MRIKRIYDNLEQFIEPNKVLVIYGPRRVGKTTMIQNFLKSFTDPYRLDTGEDQRVQETISSQNLGSLKDYVGNNQLIVIDKA